MARQKKKVETKTVETKAPVTLPEIVHEPSGQKMFICQAEHKGFSCSKDYKTKESFAEASKRVRGVCVSCLQKLNGMIKKEVKLSDGRTLTAAILEEKGVWSPASGEGRGRHNHGLDALNTILAA